jgi:cytochrome c oxidase cbb3-type subunit 3
MADFDGIQEEHNKIPAGWMLFFIGIIAWLVWYIYSFTPQLSGWSYYTGFAAEMKSAKQQVAKPMTENPYEHDEKAVAEGKGIYAANCAACHGQNLKGGVGPDLTGHFKYGETDDKKYISIAKGTAAGMPGFEDQLGRDRIWKVLAYVDSVREYDKKP